MWLNAPFVLWSPAAHVLLMNPQTLAKVSRQESAIHEAARQVIQAELQEEAYERLAKIKKSILEPVQGVGSSFQTGNQELRRKYASMSAAELVLTVFNNAKELFSKRMARVSGPKTRPTLLVWEIQGPIY